jgi:hypothetical protein
MRLRITTRKVIQRDFQKVTNETADSGGAPALVVFYEISDRELQRRLGLIGPQRSALILR